MATRLVCDLVEHRSVAYPPSVAPRHLGHTAPGADHHRAGLPARRGHRPVLRRGGQGTGRRAWRAWTPSVRTARPSTTGSRATAARGTLQLGRAGLDRRADGRRRRERRPQPRHRRRWPRGAPGQPARRPAARRAPPPPRAARSTSAASPTSPCSAPAASRSPSTSAPPMPSSTPPSRCSPAASSASTATGPGRPRARPTRRWSQRLLDDPYFALPAAQVDGQGVLQPRLRDRAPRRQGDSAAEDLLASLTVATAESVAAALRPFESASSSWPAAAPATSP